MYKNSYDNKSAYQIYSKKKDIHPVKNKMNAPKKTSKEYPPLFCILLDLDKERGVKYIYESANI